MLDCEEGHEIKREHNLASTCPLRHCTLPHLTKACKQTAYINIREQIMKA